MVSNIKGNSVGNKYSEVFLAYLAGFFDGDGAVMVYFEKNDKLIFNFQISDQNNLAVYSKIRWAIEKYSSRIENGYNF